MTGRILTRTLREFLDKVQKESRTDPSGLSTWVEIFYKSDSAYLTEYRIYGMADHGQIP